MEEFMPKALAFASQHTVMVIAWVVVFVGTIYVFAKSIMSGAKEIDQATLSLLVNRQNAIIVDVRSVDDFLRGHIAGSQNFLPSEIKQQKLGKLEQYKEVPVIVVCATGLTSRSSAEQLYKQGFKQVYSLKEGIQGWRTANLPLVKKN
ncbi:hypothetical protein QV08_03540 [Gallibacterium salpingitidis]|uniref:rhodanese-like domain-containing protein n=1 Tax=Gallibacterium salpingitidis TaxID=505341 RepID=UPI000804F2C9|nr:rhodanese-like domain-containing protein [Gallibacterium salpingitidis]OBX08655.1 hypothetical protein QV08_03540 [Gallibacterium salpingitidis]WKS99297.1 rhodanese-like domain-containing protein [Gallibacterium salpingitidis]